MIIQCGTVAWGGFWPFHLTHFKNYGDQIKLAYLSANLGHNYKNCRFNPFFILQRREWQQNLALLAP